MKKILSIAGLAILFLFSVNAQTTVSITQIDNEKKVISYNKKVDGFKDVTIIDCKKSTARNPVSISLAQFADKDVQIDFKCQVKIETTSTDKSLITWTIDDFKAGMPELASEKLPINKWVTMKGSTFLHLTGKRTLYISGYGINKETTKIYLRDLEVKVSGDDLGNTQVLTPWLEGPSLKEALNPYFDYFGIAVTWQEEFSKPNIQKGIAYHADSITTGNEFKPDFTFRWGAPKNFVNFTGENGKKIQVPANLPGLATCASIMETAKKNNLEMRGHVLVWHSQTPKWFFKENYSTAENANYVDKETMNARQEWYIKTMMDFVADWEKNNNDGKHIIKTWDVVNEAISDNASDLKWVRENSNWYEIYHNEEFIINAFRYANKYAPKDVLLAYNDYNCYSGSAQEKGGKTNSILKLVDAIQKTPDARIDVVGMQSHVQIGYPNVTGKDSFETALQKFIAKGVDVQITELDIANGDQPYSATRLKAKYKEYFELFIRNRKTPGKHGVSGVTVWGITDNGTWLNALEQYKNKKQYPLLFTADFKNKPAVDGIIEAANEAK